MEYTLQSPPPQRVSRKKIFLGIASGIVVIVIAIAMVLLLHHLDQINQVKSVLRSIPTAMTAASDKDGNGYPVKLPNDVKFDSRVRLDGGGTFDGTVYCVSGSLIANQSIKYYVTSSSSVPQPGSCPAIPAIAKPTVAPKPTIAFINGTQIGVSWLATDNTASYTTQCAIDKNFSEIVSTRTSAELTNSCNNLKAGTGYYLRVKANNSSGEGPWSLPRFAMTTLLSASPTNLKVKPLSATSVEYSWSPVNGATSYVIEWATDINFTQDKKDVTQTATGGVSTGLKPHTVYYYHVKAVTADFDSTHAAFSNEVGTLTPEK